MGSGNEVYSVADFNLDAKWLIDPKHLFVGPTIGEGAHAKVYEGKYKNQNVAVNIVHRGETPEQIAMVIVTELLLGELCANTCSVCGQGAWTRAWQLDLRLILLLLWSAYIPTLYSTVILRHGEKKHYNHKVDAYSFAIVLWELIHNKLPFEGMSHLQAAYAAAFKNVRPSAESFPEDLALIVTSCWKEDPNDRPNFTQIIQMLLRYLSTILAPAPAVPQLIFKSENAVLPPESPELGSRNIEGSEKFKFISILCKND
ncbi:unnamed protein product [Malus baccata var. baccata]